MENNETSTVELFQFPSKEVETKHYEMLVLIGGQTTEDQAQSIFGEVKGVLTSLGGAITSEEVLGRRSLAYTVAGSKSGSYFVTEFDLPTNALAELNEKLRIRKDVTRFMITSKRIPTAEEIAEHERVQAKIETRKKAKRATQEQQDAEQLEKKAAKKAARQPASAPAASAEAKTEPKPNKEQIDTQIEKLLNNEIDV